MQLIATHNLKKWGNLFANISYEDPDCATYLAVVMFIFSMTADDR